MNVLLELCVWVWVCACSVGAILCAFVSYVSVLLVLFVCRKGGDYASGALLFLYVMYASSALHIVSVFSYRHDREVCIVWLAGSAL